MTRPQKTIFIIALALLVTSAALPVSAGLLDLPQFQDPCDVCEFARLLSEIKNIVFEVAAGLAVLFIIIGGVLLSASAGIPNQVARAKKIITSAIIGLVILLCAWLIVSAVMAATLGQDIGSNWWTVTCPNDTQCKYQTSPTPGPTPTPGPNPEGCGQGVAGAGLAGVGTCWGPCHCAHFVSTALVTTGCEGAYTPSVDTLRSWLTNHGWTAVTSPQRDDIAFQGSHVGIMTSATEAVHSGIITSNNTCGGKCTDPETRNPDDCPGCTDFGRFPGNGCHSNQCVTTSTNVGWTSWYRRPAN